MFPPPSPFSLAPTRLASPPSSSPTPPHSTSIVSRSSFSLLFGILSGQVLVLSTCWILRSSLTFRVSGISLVVRELPWGFGWGVASYRLAFCTFSRVRHGRCWWRTTRACWEAPVWIVSRHWVSAWQWTFLVLLVVSRDSSCMETRSRKIGRQTTFH